MSMSKRLGWRAKNSSARTQAIVADILQSESKKGGTKHGEDQNEFSAGDGHSQAVRPARNDGSGASRGPPRPPAASAAARGIYGQMARGRGLKGKAEKVSEKDFQKQLQHFVGDLTEASEKLKGRAKQKG